MKRFLSLLLVIVLVASIFTIGVTAKEVVEEIEINGEYVEGDAIVLIDDLGVACTSGDSEVDRLISSSENIYSFSDEEIASTGGNTGNESSGIFFIHSDKYTTKELIAKLKNAPSVLSVEPNFINNIQTADYTRFQYSNDGQHINVPNWNDKTKKNSSEDAIVAIFDSGVDYNHEDLKDVMWDKGLEYKALVDYGGGKNGYCGVLKNGSDEQYYSDEPMDDNGHGTHCAGDVAASWNDYGVSGVANGVKLMAVKTCDERGRFQDDAIYRGFEYIKLAKKEGVNIIAVNNSWGGAATSTILNDVVTDLGKQGVISVFAAGNDDVNTDFRDSTCTSFCNNPYVIVVAATDKKGKFASFSNCGIRTVDVAAPGVDILSTGIEQNKCAHPDLVKPKICDTFLNKEVLFTNYTIGTGNLEVSDKVGYDDTFSLEISHEPKIEDTFLIQLSDASSCGLDLSKDLYFSCRVKTSKNVKNWYLSKNDENKEVLANCDNKGEEFSAVTFKVPEEYIKVNDNQVLLNLTSYLTLDDDSQQNGTIYIDNVGLTNESTKYVYMSGTSMAAPIVTGEVAVLCNQYKNEPIEKIVARVKGSVDPLPEDEYKEVKSNGIVNVNNALNGTTQPVINSITYDENEFTINGYFFGTNSTVDIIGVKVGLEIVSRTDEKIVAKIPKDLKSNEYIIEVINGDLEGQFLLSYKGDNFYEKINAKDSDEAISMLSKCYSNCALGVNDSLYILSQYENEVEKGILVQYDIKKNKYIQLTDTPFDELKTNPVLYQGNIYVIGSTKDEKKVYYYDILENKWYYIDKTVNKEVLPDAISTLVSNGRDLYLIGGGKTEGQFSLAVDTIIKIDVGENNNPLFSVVNVKLKEKRLGANAIADSNGNIYVFDGMSMSASKQSITSFEKITCENNVLTKSEIVSEDPLSECDLFRGNSDYSYAISSDKIYLYGALKLESGTVVNDTFSMSIGGTKFTPENKKMGYTKLSNSTIATYKDYMYILGLDTKQGNKQVIARDKITYTYPQDEVAELFDANMDKTIDIVDANCIQRHLANLETTIYLPASDVDKDNEVTIIDATCIQRKLAGLLK